MLLESTALRTDARIVQTLYSNYTYLNYTQMNRQQRAKNPTSFIAPLSIVDGRLTGDENCLFTYYLRVHHLRTHGIRILSAGLSLG